MGSNFPHIEPLRSWPRARLANHLSPGGCASTQSPTSCISPQRPSQDEPAVEGQSCSGEWLALAPLISQSSASRVSIRPASGQLAAARQQTNAGIDIDAVAAPPSCLGQTLLAESEAGQTIRDGTGDRRRLGSSARTPHALALISRLSKGASACLLPKLLEPGWKRRNLPRH